MNKLEASIVMIGLFVLRCIVPLVVVIVLGHMMNRLLDRWAAAEALQEADDAETRQWSPHSPLRSRSVGLRAPLPSLLLPCWIMNNCDEAKCAKCPAYQQRGIPCWQARLDAEGKLPDACPTCPRYLGLPASA